MSAYVITSVSRWSLVTSKCSGAVTAATRYSGAVLAAVKLRTSGQEALQYI